MLTSTSNQNYVKQLDAREAFTFQDISSSLSAKMQYPLPHYKLIPVSSIYVYWVSNHIYIFIHTYTLSKREKEKNS